MAAITVLAVLVVWLRPESDATFFPFGCGCQSFQQSCAPVSCPVAYGPCGPQTFYQPRVVGQPVVVQQASSYVSPVGYFKNTLCQVNQQPMIQGQFPPIVKPVCGERRRKQKVKKRPKRRIETRGKDPKCNSERLKKIMHEVFVFFLCTSKYFVLSTIRSSVT